MTDLRALWGRKQAHGQLAGGGGRAGRAASAGRAGGAASAGGLAGRIDAALAPPEGSGWRLDLPAVPGALTTAGVAWLQGLRQAFAERGADAYDPASKEWDPGHDSWLFVVPDATPPPFDPRTVTPLPVRGWRWHEAAPGVWVHARADAVFWARHHTVFARWPIGLYSVTWPDREPEPAVVARLRRRLERIATSETALTAAPAGYVARQYDWFRRGERAPRVRP